MASTAAIRLGSVDVKGGLWGADLLAALADDRTRLLADTIAPTSYGLPARASTEQAARAAWTVLTAAWDEFTEQRTAEVERDGTDDYGDDRFTYVSWVRHLLTQLGYTPTETPPGGLAVDDEHDLNQDGQPDRFPITHQHADQVPLHLLAAGVPLDRRTRGVVGAHAQSPHSVVQDYLNRTATHLWAIVTNGLTLRILRDNAALSRQAYIEFDLAAIFDDGAYADFALLWHAAHATRFTYDPDNGPADCIAETWQEHATVTGVAALDDLRDGVEAAIAEIGQGLVEHPANRSLRTALADPDDPFDAAALYRELLYVAYRHVFWFTLDDRDLLHPPDAARITVALYRDHYASTVLRAKARAHLGGHHPDAWQHFTTVAGWFASPDGQPALALPGLLGRVWDPAVTAHLNNATLTNRRYYEAVRRLAYITRDGALQRINYDAMGSEELGAVYESLLEIRPTADTDNRRFQLGRTDGSDRKKTGSYYTPTSLIKVLLDEALDPVLDERIKQAVHDLPADTSPEERRQAQEQTILTTTVCDPAMGSAHFLVGAGMRVAKRLAQLRTDEVEPSPGAIQHAFRDVASRCLYGVDVNPMAVELAKVAIWLECHVPGQPLTFLDHHLKTGNALLGVGFDPDLIAWHRTAKKAADQKGVPDAAFKPLAGDDKSHARLLRDRNKQRRGGGGQLRLGVGTHHDRLDQLADSARQLDELADDSPDALAAKQHAWDTAQHDPELQRQRLRADAWMAAWTFPKTKDAAAPLTSNDPLAHDELPWDVYYDTFLGDDLHLDRPGVRAVGYEAERLAFFHWHLEFPDIAAQGGFDLMLGNPPWERIKLAEKEWFAAAGYDHIANAANAADRKRAIAGLADSGDSVDRQIANRWQRDSRDAQAIAEYARKGGRYPLGGVGDINTYALFADHFLRCIVERGRAGIIVPAGLVSDFTYAGFFSYLVDNDLLRACHTALEIRDHFPGITSGAKPFTLLCAGAPGSAAARYTSGFLNTDEIGSPDRTYSLSPDDLNLLCPSVKLAPNMRSSQEVALWLKAADLHQPLFRSWPWATRAGAVLASVDGTDVIVRQLPALCSDSEGFVGLLEGKMISHWDHAFAEYTRAYGADAAPVEPDRRATLISPLSRHAASGSVVEAKFAEVAGELCVGWRDIANATNARTLIPVVLPPSAMDNTFNVGFPRTASAALWLTAMLASYCCDWLLRCRISGNHVKPHVVEALPVPDSSVAEGPTPWEVDVRLATWVNARAAALSANTQVLAQLLGYEAAIWDRDRRERWRTELEAAVLHLYGLDADEAGYVLDTFDVVAARDRRTEGRHANDSNWRTKRLILEKYDALARHAEAGTTYVSPDPPPPLPEKLRLRNGEETNGE